MDYRKTLPERCRLSEEFSRFTGVNSLEVRVAIERYQSYKVFVVATVPDVRSTRGMAARYFMTGKLNEYLLRNKAFLLHNMHKRKDGKVRKPLADIFGLYISRNRETLLSAFREYLDNPFRHKWHFADNFGELDGLFGSSDKNSYWVLLITGNKGDQEAIDRDWVSEYINYTIGILQKKQFNACRGIAVISNDDLNKSGKKLYGNRALMIKNKTEKKTGGMTLEDKYAALVFPEEGKTILESEDVVEINIAPSSGKQ